MGKAYFQYGIIGERDKRVDEKKTRSNAKSLSLWHWAVVGDAHLGVLRLRFPHKHPYVYRHII